MSMSLIGQDDLFLALFFVSLLLAVISVPRMVATVRHSRKEIGRYRELRGIKDIGGLPVSTLAKQEWERARSSVGYSALLLGEIERLNDLRPSVLQAQASALLMLVLAVIPGFERTVLIFALGLVAVVLASSVYSSRLSEGYVNEYMEMLSEFDDFTNGNTSIYG